MPRSPIGPCVRVSWEVGYEYLPLHPEHKTSEPIHTFEYWTAFGKFVEYRPDIEVFESGDILEYRLIYLREAHPEIADDEGSYWGSSTIVIDRNSGKVSANWKGIDNDDYDGQARAILINEAQRIRGTARPAQRNQIQLRQLLLCTDRNCAITGEETQAALDAVHIIAVVDGGRETNGNAILLRADIHRLYDAGQFRIDRNGKVVEISTELSDYYRELLRHKELDQDLTRRIEASLSKKSAISMGN